MDNQVFLENFEELKKVIIQNADYDLKKNDSKLDLENLNSAISGKLILKGFGEFESELDLTTFDWINGSSDRNWWWQIQALPFLNWYIGCHDLTSDEEKVLINEFIKKCVFNWIEKSKQDIRTPLLWHDHTTAFRLRHLVRWINFLVLKDLYQDYISFEEQKILLDLVQKHIEFLNFEENYSKHTNHGFDQMLIVYTVSLLWSNVNYLNEAGELAEKRLEEELDFAFTHQGVHVENSPGYQKFMLSRIELLTELKELGDNRLSKKAFDLIERAKKFLEVITMPNGYIPMIGDTKGDDKGLQVQLSENIEFYDYSESGYYIAKGLASDGKAIHLVFKCSHMSNYHRHDDDLSFHLFYDDEVIFGDGGLGFYQEKDERRIFLRSNQAHNTVFPLGIDAIRVPNELKAKPTMKVLEPGLVVAETSMYGGRLQRVLDIRNLKDFEMIIQDRWLELPEAKEQKINFYLPYSSRLSNLMNKCEFKTPNKKVVVLYANNFNSFYVNTGWNQENNYGCTVSKKFANFTNCSNFGWNGFILKNYNYQIILSINGKINETTIKNINGSNIINEEIFNITYRDLTPVKILNKNEWDYDDKIPNNFNHHIMSLRWLQDINNKEQKLKIVLDFIKYHNENKKASRYYLGSNADHTASIRVSVLNELLSSLRSNEEHYKLVLLEIYKTVDAFFKDTYKESNNHGLMVDISILESLQNKDLLNKYETKVPILKKRILNQLVTIFDENGFVKEHSISYQEYNLNILFNLKDAVKKSQIEFNELDEFVEKCVLNIKEILGFALKSNKEYFAIGDSFDTPNSAILKRIYGVDNPNKALLPFSEKEGLCVSKTLGIAIFRNKDWHISLNACWHSYVHKQNDDLGLNLRYKDIDFIIDGGYSDIVDREEINTRSELLHSTIIPTNRVWLDRGKNKEGYSTITDGYTSSLDSFNVKAEHTRVPDMKLSRSLKLKDDEIIISDDVPENIEAIHRFIVPLHIEILIKDGVVTLRHNQNVLSLESDIKQVDIEQSVIETIKNNKKIVSNVLDFKCFGSLSVSINCIDNEDKVSY